MDLPIEAAGEPPVEWDLHAEGRQPDRGEEQHAGQAEGGRHRGESRQSQRHGGEEFERHRGHHHPAGAPDVLSVVLLEAIPADPRHQRIVDDLHVPDHTDHEKCRNEMEPHHVRERRRRCDHVSPHRRSARTASAV